MQNVFYEFTVAFNTSGGSLSEAFDGLDVAQLNRDRTRRLAFLSLNEESQCLLKIQK